MKRAAARTTRHSRPNPKHTKYRLDRPPQGEPLLTAANRRSGLAPSEKGLSSSQRILVVEDEAFLRQIYLAALLRCGYQVTTAENGEAGWHALRSASLGVTAFDLLITDNTMPLLSGIELIQRLHFWHLDIPVILASGEIPERIERLHLAAILQKPISPRQLIQTVQEVLRVKGLQSS